MLTELDDIKRSIEQSLPPHIVAAMRDEGISLTLTPSSEPEPIVTISDELAEREFLGDMVNYKKDITGIANTIFISQKAYSRHGPRIKVAIGPPHSISVTTKTVSVAIDSGKVVAGDIKKVSAALQKKLHKFVALNQEALLNYWNEKITTNVLEKRLKPLPEE